MSKIIKLYYSYLFSTMTTMIFIIINMFICTAMLISSGVLDGYHMMDLYRNEYQIVFYMDSLTIIKVSMVMIAILISTILNSESANNLSTYIVDDRRYKYTIFLSKFVLQISVLFIFLVFSFSVNILINILLTPYSFELTDVLNSFLLLFLLVVFYSCLTNLLMTISSTILISIFPLALFWIMEANATLDAIQSANTLKTLYKIVPHCIFVNGQLQLYDTLEAYTLVIIGAMWGNSLYFVKKDIS